MGSIHIVQLRFHGNNTHLRSDGRVKREISLLPSIPPPTGVILGKVLSLCESQFLYL